MLILWSEFHGQSDDEISVSMCIARRTAFENRTSYISIIGLGCGWSFGSLCVTEDFIIKTGEYCGGNEQPCIVFRIVSFDGLPQVFEVFPSL